MAVVIDATLSPLPGTTPPAPLPREQYQAAIERAVPTARVRVDIVDLSRLVVPALRYRLRVALTFPQGLATAGEATTQLALMNQAINETRQGTWFVTTRAVHTDVALPAGTEAVAPAPAPRTAARVREVLTGARVVSAAPTRAGKVPTAARTESAEPTAPPTDQLGAALPLLAVGAALIVVGVVAWKVAT